MSDSNLTGKGSAAKISGLDEKAKNIEKKYNKIISYLTDLLGKIQKY